MALVDQPHDPAMAPLSSSSAPQQQVMDPFKSHLVALLSLYNSEVTPFATRPPIPEYDGSADWQTDAILKAIDKMAHRMWRAEERITIPVEQVRTAFVFH